MLAGRRPPGVGFLKREVVVSAGAGHEAWLVGKEGAVGVEGVVDLADGEEDVAGGAEGGGGVARVVVLVECREQIGVLGEEDLDEEEQRRVEERQRLGDGQRYGGGREHGSPRGCVHRLRAGDLGLGVWPKTSRKSFSSRRGRSRSAATASSSSARFMRTR